MAIEQAIFTSAQTSRGSGYHLVAASTGIGEFDARALAAWGPSHGSLLDERTDATSCNFYPLPSGAFCVSKTVAAGPEYSGRGGLRVYTQSLVVPADDLARFANNPFAVLRAASAAGHLHVLDELPETLPTLQLTGRANAVDRGLLANLQVRPGALALAALVQAALAGRPLVVTGQARGEAVVAGLINCLPIALRKDLSFSTGLVVSPQRPVRLAWLGEHAAIASRLLRHGGLDALDLEEAARGGSPALAGWAAFVHAALPSGRVAALASELITTVAPMTRHELDARGERLRATLAADGHQAGPSREPCAAATRSGTTAAGTASPAVSQAGAADHHAAVRSATARATAASRNLLPAPTRGQSPQIVEMLEAIDDRVYDAIAGERRALEELEVLWPTVLDELSSELVLESREHYLHHALTVWSQACEGPRRDPTVAAAALDVIAVLFDG